MGAAPHPALTRHLPPAGEGFSGSGKVSGSTQRLPLGGAGALAPEGVTPPREKGIAERPQALRYPK